MASWAEFYKGRILDSGYLDYARTRYAPYLNAIRARMKGGDRIVEIGCGLATMTRLLVDDNVRPWVGFRAYDINPDMVTYARQTLNDGYPVQVADARQPTGALPDVIHSHGMLEHFCDDDICKVIAANKADGARCAVHYVPGDKYVIPSFGDERLMTVAQWQDIAKPDAVLTFNDGYDYAMIWDF